MTNEPARSANAVVLPRLIAPKAVLRRAKFRSLATYPSKKSRGEKLTAENSCRDRTA